MKLQQMKDGELLADTKKLVQNERDVVTQILHHLGEIDRRKLYCDLGFGSLFEYAVKDLKYSESQASRRIQAMRLIKEIPQVEKSIATGELSLSNVSQAQVLFRTVAKESPQRAMGRQEKISVLNSLKNKSTREGQKQLLKLQPQAALPKEKERAVTETATEVRFVMSDKLKTKLEQVRSLLGTKGTDMSYAELFDEMAELSVMALEEKKFGKKRAAATKIGEGENSLAAPQALTDSVPRISKNERYISKSLSCHIWKRDQGKCTNCGGRKNLNIDHLIPIALGGKSEARNLRLLCFSCNHRAAMKTFGVDHMRNKYQRPTAG